MIYEFSEGCRWMSWVHSTSLLEGMRRHRQEVPCTRGSQLQVIYDIFRGFIVVLQCIAGMVRHSRSSQNWKWAVNCLNESLTTWYNSIYYIDFNLYIFQRHAHEGFLLTVCTRMVQKRKLLQVISQVVSPYMTDENVGLEERKAVFRHGDQ